jgi:hypothetical protein
VDLEDINDKAVIAFKAGLIGIPVIGPSLEKLCFGAVDELRMRRVEATLQKIGEALGRDGRDHKIKDNEDFASFLENVVPKLARATSEDKRVAFRNLLLNATQLPSGDLKWTEADLAIRLLDSVNEVGLSLLSALFSIRQATSQTRQSIFLMQDEQLIIPENMADKYREHCIEDGINPILKFSYHDSVAKFWIEELERLKMIRFGLFEVVEYQHVCLTHRAGLLIEWTLGDGRRLWM